MVSQRDEEKLLMGEDVRPATIEDAEVRMPLALPGDLPENHARDPLAQRPPRDAGVLRMPEATAEALGANGENDRGSPEAPREEG